MTKGMTVHLLRRSFDERRVSSYRSYNLSENGSGKDKRTVCIYIHDASRHSVIIIMDTHNLISNFNLESKLSVSSYQTRGINKSNPNNFNPQSSLINSTHTRPKVNRLNFHKKIDVSLIKGYTKFKTWLIDINKILDDQFPQQREETDEVC